MSFNKTDREFALKLYKDSNFIVFTIQIDFFSHKQPVLTMKLLLLGNIDLIFPAPTLRKRKQQIWV